MTVYEIEFTAPGIAGEITVHGDKNVNDAVARIRAAWPAAQVTVQKVTREQA